MAKKALAFHMAVSPQKAVNYIQILDIWTQCSDSLHDAFIHSIIPYVINNVITHHAINDGTYNTDHWPQGGSRLGYLHVRRTDPPSEQKTPKRSLAEARFARRSSVQLVVDAGSNVGTP